jgi:hypothetical protein
MVFNATFNNISVISLQFALYPHFTGIERTTTLQGKLYGPVDALQKTTRFVAETEIQEL